jgi:tRNA-splicing ligase RtcB
LLFISSPIRPESVDFSRRYPSEATGVCKREGLVKPEMMNDWMQKSNVVLRGGGLDESPHCYKRLPEVLEAHGETIRILHTLTPLGVAMAGANEFDPYKD